MEREREKDFTKDIVEKAEKRSMDAHMIVFRKAGEEGWGQMKRENLDIVLERIRRNQIDALDEDSLTDREKEVLKEEGIVLSEPEEIEIGGEGKKRTIRRILEQKP